MADDIPDEIGFTIELAAAERAVLRQGLLQWGGPTQITDHVASTIGYVDAEEFDTARIELVRALLAAEPLSIRDWRRTITSAEVVFLSNEFGAGLEWEIVTGLTDEETLRAIRSIQRKLVIARSAVE